MHRLVALTLLFFNAVLLGPLSAASGAMGEPSWRVFKSKPGRFGVEMPGKPQRTDTRTTSFIGTITTHIFLVRSGNEEYVEEYVVSYSDLPGFAVKFAGSGTIYNNAKGSLLMETLGKEEQFENAPLNGMQGKHLVYDMPDRETNVDMRGEAYLFVVGKRLYIIDVNAPIGEMPTDAPRFFSSFRIK